MKERLAAGVAVSATAEAGKKQDPDKPFAGAAAAAVAAAVSTAVAAHNSAAAVISSAHT